MQVKDEMPVPEDEADSGAAADEAEVGNMAADKCWAAANLTVRMTKSIERAFYRVVQRD